MKFDAERNRWAFIEGGGLRRASQVEDLSGKPIGNFARSDLQRVVESWLAGLHVEMAHVVPRSVEWLNQAIANGEKFGQSPAFHAMQLHWARAMGLWMLNGTNVESDWDAALNYEKNFWNEEASSDAWKVKNDLDDFMAFALQARRYSEGIDTYERLQGTSNFNLKKVVKPRDYAYAMCLQNTAPQFDEDQIFNLGCKILMKNVGEVWLARGQSLRCAMWLKIVYWDRNPSISPLQTVLKAYENMPGESFPVFLNVKNNQ